MEEPASVSPVQRVSRSLKLWPVVVLLGSVAAAGVFALGLWSGGRLTQQKQQPPDREIFTLKGHTAGLWCVVFASDGKHLASASGDKTIKVWDATTGREMLSLQGHTLEVHSVAFSPDGKRLASGSGEVDKDTPGEVKVWDAQTGKETFSLQGHTRAVLSVGFSPDGNRLASASNDRTVKVWDVLTRKEVFSLMHEGYATSVCFSPDGERLASASWDNTVKVWDAQNGQKILSLVHEHAVSSVCFSPDGKRLASASGLWLQEGEVYVWDAQCGQRLLSVTWRPAQLTTVWDPNIKKGVLSIKGHADQVHNVCFSPDSKRVASASEGYDWRDGRIVTRWGEVKVWDAQTGNELFTLKGHTDEVFSVCFSPDGNRLASASMDRTVKVWDVHTAQK
jgi:WD40 repeat protein